MRPLSGSLQCLLSSSGQAGVPSATVTDTTRRIRSQVDDRQRRSYGGYGEGQVRPMFEAKGRRGPGVREVVSRFTKAESHHRR